MLQQVIDSSQIVVPENRQRRSHNAEKVHELAKSIGTLGLMHPIVLRSDGVTLVAGFRRLTAIRELNAGAIAIRHNGVEVQLGMIPFIRMDQLDTVALREAELAENLYREDLSWTDRSAAIAEIHSMRKANNPNQTFKQTAEEVAGEELHNGGTPVAEVSDAVFIQPYLDDPEVAKAGSLKEAKAIVSRRLERDFRIALAKHIGSSALGSSHSLIKGDCVEVLKGMADERYDVVVTDPPYGIEADQFGTQSITGHQYNDSIDEMFNLHTVLAPELYRTMKPDSHMYMFCDNERFPKLKIIYQHHGFTVWRTPLIWNKSPIGMLPSAEYGPRRCYETIMFASKGKRQVTSVYSDVLSYPPLTIKTHAAEKPVDVYVDLLRRSALAGQSILDCFGGSGVVFPAATRLKLAATAIELDDASYTLCAQRLQKEAA